MFSLYLGSTIEATGGCGADVDNRVRSAWNSWRGLSGVICDKKVPVKLTNKLYKTVIGPTLIYGSECWALHRAVQQRMHTTDMKMLRWIQGKHGKTEWEMKSSVAMQWPIQSPHYITQKRLSWYVLSYIRQTAHFWLTQEWFSELSSSRLESGVHDRLHIYSLCGIFYFPLT